MAHHSFRLLLVLSLFRGSGASLVRIRSASSRWRVSCTDGTTHEGRGRFAGRLAAREDSNCTLSFDFRAKDGLDVAPAAIVSSSHVGLDQLAAPEEGDEEFEAEPSHPRRRTALNSSAMNQTESSRGCSDFPLPFVENLSPVTLLGGNCSTTIALSSHLFPAFASGVPSVCRASYDVWVQQTGLLQTSSSPPPLAYGVTDPSAPMAELCAATCSAAGVQSSHCAVPSPPPAPPPAQPSAGGTGNGSHTIEATTVEQLHQALSTGYSRGHVDIRVPAGTMLNLEGRMLLVDGINVTIRSDGGEAVFDSQGRSRLFEVLSGGSLHLESLRLLNGWADISGGALMVRGAAATLVRCSLLNSSSAAAGGAAIVLDGELLLLDCLVRGSSSMYGGAFYVNGASAIFLQHSIVSVSFAAKSGGVIYSVGDSNTAFVIECDISDSTAASGGAVCAFLGSSVSISCKSKISHSSAFVSGGVFFARAGVISLSDGCLVSHSRATLGGGMLACVLSLFTVNNCTIEHSTVSEPLDGGGALWLQVSSYCAISNYSTIARSAALGQSSEGGAIYLASSTLEISLGCSILHSTAAMGGAILVSSGNLRVVDACVIANSASTQDGGALHITSSNVIISGGSKILDSTATICNATPVEPIPVSSLGCGDKFIFREQERGVCASANADACYEEALLVASSLKSVTCRCPWPEYPDPALEERLAPYLESGCIRPMQLTGITVVSEKVAVTLQKPENLEAHVNLTLQIEGTDNARPAVWRLLNTSSLLLRSPWLRLPTLSGTVYPQSISSGVTFALVPLTFSASGLLERAALYEERLTVDVRSEIGVAAKTQVVDVSLSVQARTSFVVWGSVHRQSGVQLKCEVQQLRNQAFLVDTPRRQYFTACDVDSLPVDHLLPLQRDPRRFRAVMNTSAGNANELGVSYVGAGVYDISFAIPTWGATNISLLLDETHVESLAGNAICPLYRVPLPDGRCGCSAGFFRTFDAVECAPCQQGRTSLPGAQRAEDCSLCADGFYRPSAHSTSSACVSCLAGANCTSNATLQSLLVLDGFWRLSDSSTELLPCPNGRGAICVGGGQTGSCAPGFKGPLCKVCSRSDQYFVDGECLDCPDATGRLLLALGIVVALVTLFVLAQVWNPQCNHCRYKTARRTLKWSHVVLSAVPSGVQLRILLSFYQCVTSISDVYSIDFEPPYTDFLQALNWIRVDWLSILMPASCVGRLEHRILLVALAPFGAMAFGVVLQLLLSKARGVPLTRGVSASTSLCLFVVFLLSPQITQAIFEAFQCVPFEWSPTVTHYYMRSSLSVQCYTFDHDRIALISYVLMVVWPIGSVLLFFSLVYRARSRLIEHTRDEFVVSIRLLHNDYKPESYFWASVELVHRSILIGWVLLIDEEKSFLRLVVANIICVIMLTWTSITLPYLRMHDNVLAIAAALLLQLTYIWSSYVKVLHALKEHFYHSLHSSVANTTMGPPFTAERFWRCAQKSLSMGKRWMLFISHVWRTGQDQAAYIKRQLQRMLPSIPIFLDVDDLVSIDLLEEYIDASGCVLLFLSRGYLISHNCLRETRRAVHTRLALCFVWEADHAKGGAPLHYLRDHECPQDLVEVIFGDDGKIIQWHRAIEFQLLTLKKIAEAALLASPAYSHKKSLPLSVHGEVALGVKQRAPKAVYIYASSNNAGARTFAQELQEDHLSNLFIAEKMPSEADWRGSRTMVHFFLYLSKDTFAGNSGARLAAEIRMARKRRIPFVLVHENDVARGGCEFSWVLDSTPQDLVQDGLYKEQLAIPLMRSDHREVSFALVARKLAEQGRCNALYTAV
ncbi:hypothetical protein AB1Y20_009256 [Prymnesium parvum]|uniref:TIR domain-containing protein n=1 Tax=Prymnesium parvum TaxID=97485 RepID=A0AB34K121_PRYPA